MEDGFSISGKIMANIVKEQDKYTIEYIEKYVQEQERHGNILYSTIIGEGQLRHIINLGLTALNQFENLHIKPFDLFQQEEYITYLREEIHRYQEENQKLKNQIRIMEDTYNLRNVDTKSGGE